MLVCVYFCNMTVTKHFSADKPTSQSYPFSSSTTVTGNRGNSKSQIDDTHGVTQGRSVTDIYIYIMYTYGTYFSGSVPVINKVTLWGSKIRGCWWSTRSLGSCEARLLVALSWECGCQFNKLNNRSWWHFQRPSAPPRPSSLSLTPLSLMDCRKVLLREADLPSSHTWVPLHIFDGTLPLQTIYYKNAIKAFQGI